MHLQPTLPAMLSSLALLLLQPAAAAAGASSSELTTTVAFHVPATNALPNPFSLPASTHATLTALGSSPALRAPLSGLNAFVFRNVSAGSYLVDVHAPSHAFAPLRLDVGPAAAEEEEAAAAEEGKGKKQQDKKKKKLVARAWETYRGNDWDNKGEALAPGGLGGGGDDDGVVVFEVRPLGAKNFFMERSKFSVLSILKNPMILLGLVSMVIFFGMPYLVDNMDPEMRAEWEERQKTNPMNSLLAASQPGGGGNPMGNFDVAAYLAGSTKKEDSPSAAAPATPQAGGNGGGSGKKGKRDR